MDSGRHRVTCEVDKLWLLIHGGVVDVGGRCTQCPAGVIWRWTSLSIRTNPVVVWTAGNDRTALRQLFGDVRTYVIVRTACKA